MDAVDDGTTGTSYRLIISRARRRVGSACSRPEDRYDIGLPDFAICHRVSGHWSLPVLLGRGGEM